MILLIFAVLLQSVSAAPVKQTWADALQSQNYQKAAELLHLIVTDVEYSIRAQDPQPTRQLAVLYASGLGVSRDPIAACSLAQTSAIVARQSAHRYARNVAAYDAVLAEADRFVEEHCAVLSPADRRDATLSIECYAFGMPEEVLMVGGQLVRIGRSGIGVLDTPEAMILGLLNCPLYVAGVRRTSVQAPADAGPRVAGRDVIELFTWLRGGDPARSHVLRWHAYEVYQGRVVLTAMEDVQTTTAWPPSLPPAALHDQVSLAMNHSGRVRWRIDGPVPRSGWLRVPE